MFFGKSGAWQVERECPILKGCSAPFASLYVRTACVPGQCETLETSSFLLDSSMLAVRIKGRACR